MPPKCAGVLQQSERVFYMWQWYCGTWRAVWLWKRHWSGRDLFCMRRIAYLHVGLCRPLRSSVSVYMYMYVKAHIRTHAYIKTHLA